MQHLQYDEVLMRWSSDAGAKVLTVQYSVDDVIYFRQSNAALMLECIVDGVMQR